MELRCGRTSAFCSAGCLLSHSIAEILKVRFPDRQQQKLETCLEMQILGPLVNKKLWIQGPSVCVLTSLPGDTEVVQSFKTTALLERRTVRIVLIFMVSNNMETLKEGSVNLQLYLGHNHSWIRSLQMMRIHSCTDPQYTECQCRFLLLFKW